MFGCRRNGKRGTSVPMQHGHGNWTLKDLQETRLRVRAQVAAFLGLRCENLLLETRSLQEFLLKKDLPLLEPCDWRKPLTARAATKMLTRNLKEKINAPSTRSRT
ncbi:hypothetical protein NL676_038435 [Syzygium grande]|nr:hypothetical protein NL676_038435 [Syzygium grande]